MLAAEARMSCVRCSVEIVVILEYALAQTFVNFSSQTLLRFFFQMLKRREPSLWLVFQYTGQTLIYHFSSAGYGKFGYISDN